jgi:hypothetical protein
LLAWRVTPAGLLEWCGPDAPGGADLRLCLAAANPALLAAQMLTGIRPAVDVAGDAQLAGDVNWLMQNLRWDPAADLERVFPPPVAQGLHRVGSRAGRRPEGGGPRRRDAPPALAGPPGHLMRHLFRLVFIVFTVLRFGLDEVALSGFRQRWVRAWCAWSPSGRRLDAPRGVRLRWRWSGWGRSSSSSARCCRPGATCCRWTWPTNWPAAGPRAAVPGRAGARAGRKGLRPALDEVFATFEAEPVASASIAQVHFATLKGGREVAVKVLRPGMLDVIEDDLTLLHTLARWVERLSVDGKR